MFNSDLLPSVLAAPLAIFSSASVDWVKRVLQFGQNSPHTLYPLPSALAFIKNCFLGPRCLPVGVLVRSHAVVAGCIVFIPLACDHNKLPSCAPSSRHTRISDMCLSALTVLWWWWLRLSVFFVFLFFNGACISDAFDNHVHISEFSWWRHRPERLIVFLFVFLLEINPEWS